MYSVSSDVSRFEWEFRAIIWVPEYFGEITNSKRQSDLSYLAEGARFAAPGKCCKFSLLNSWVGTIHTHTYENHHFIQSTVTHNNAHAQIHTDTVFVHVYMYMWTFTYQLCIQSVYWYANKSNVGTVQLMRGGGLGSRPKKMYGERLGHGVEYHLMSPTPRR